MLATVKEVVDHLTGLGYTISVIFDANAGYKLQGKYQRDGSLGHQLGLLTDTGSWWSTKATPADPTILAAARHLGGRIVTNDKFRDWAGTNPEVNTPGHLIQGGYRDGKLWLDLPAP